MPIETNLNQSPFYDDYSEAKNFHRVLFRPGYAVQARELTQLQTILQNQIERGFNEILKDGTIVTGVPITTDKVHYVKLRDKDANTRSILTSDFYTTGKLTNAIAVGTTSGITGQIVGVEDGSEAAATTSGNFTLFINYIDSGTNNTTKTFSDNEVLTVRLRNGNAFVVAANTIATSAIGQGFRAMVGDGVVYNKGHFVRVTPQSHIMSKYSLTPTRHLGFETTETTVNSNEDASLLDNATGATNYAAPGAERLKLSPTLTSRVAVTANTSTFFAIAAFEDGKMIVDNKESKLADLGDYINKRIYETSGDYITKPFSIRIREHLRSADNLGRYNLSGDYYRLVAEIEPGIGYVRGNRTEILSSVFKTFDKATQYTTKNARTLSASFGNYVIVDECVGPWDMRSLRTIDLRSAAGNAISTRTHGSTTIPGSSVGSAKVRGFEYHSGTSGHSSGQYRIYLFDIKMEPTKNFADHVLSLAYNAASGTDSLADCVLESSKAVLKETNINKLIFPFAQNGTRTLKDVDDVVDTQWVTRKASKLTFSGSSNRSATLSIANTSTGGTEVFNDSVTSATDRKKFIVYTTEAKNTVTLNGTITATGNAVTGSSTTFTTHFVVGDIIREAGGNTAVISAITDPTHLRVLSNSLGGTTASSTLGAKTYTQHYPAGHIFDFSTDGGSSTNDSSTQKTVHIGGANVASGSWTGEVFYNVSRTAAVQANKAINKNKYVHLNLGLANTSNATAAPSITGPWSLGVPDAMKIRKVWKGSNTAVAAATGTDVTSHFILDTGATDSFYGTSKLRKKTTSSLSLAVGDGLLVEFDHFTVDTSSGIGFFSVDSYPIDDTLSSNTTAIMTKDIPVHISPSTGFKADLRNSIDFRPRLAATATPHATGTAAAAPTNPAVLTAITHNAVGGSYMPTPDENFQCDVQFYLPRKDNIILTAQGNIEIIKGVPSTSPRTPFDVSESMILGTLTIPVFPSLSPHVAKQTKRRDLDVRLDLKDNRRFTMKDLRAVNQRVKNLEYYVSLNSLESSAKNKQIFNSAGFDRFKNGFFVDNFDGHNNADRGAEGYAAAIDINKSQLRPTFKRKDIGLKLSTSIANTAIRQTGNIITLAYTDVSYINQDKATKLRNPVQATLFAWKGKLILDPEIDNISDVTTLPDIQIDFDGMYNSLGELGEMLGIDTGINYGDWITTNTSTDVTYASHEVNLTDEEGHDYSRTDHSKTTTTTSDQIKKGSQLNISPGKNVFEIGNFVDNVSVRDYMRSRLIKFTAHSMRPSTRVWPYFDDELVSKYCTPTNSSFANTNIEGSALTTDASGTLYGNFRIPNNDNLKFRVGERKFALKDIANTQIHNTLLSTQAQATYVSSPLDVQMQGTSLNITTPEYNTLESVDTRTLTSSITVNLDNVTYTEDGDDWDETWSEPDPNEPSSGSYSEAGIGTESNNIG